MTNAAYAAYWEGRVRAQQAEMAELTFGVEIETYALRGTHHAAKVVQAALGGNAEVYEVGGYYGKWAATDAQGRKWIAMTDGSISGNGGAEVVTPILQGEADILLLQVVVRALRAAGAKSDAAHQCGVHVHVGLQRLDTRAIGRLAKTVAKYDGFIRKAGNVAPERARWCMPLPAVTTRALGAARTKRALALAWYGCDYDAQQALGYDGHQDHYHGTRYKGLNLHSYFYKNRGTAEFRYFNGTLHAGVIRAYVQLALALVAKAKTTTAATMAPVPCETRAQAANALVNLGLTRVGDQDDAYKTARTHLLAAWGGRTAVRADRVAA